MKKLVWVIVLAAACGKPKHLPECDAFEQTMDKILNCKSLPKTIDRATIESARKRLKGAFEMLDQAGGIEKAPQETQDTLRESCRSQNKQVVEAYQTVAPDCLK